MEEAPIYNLSTEPNSILSITENFMKKNKFNKKECLEPKMYKI